MMGDEPQEDTDVEYDNEEPEEEEISEDNVPDDDDSPAEENDKNIWDSTEKPEENMEKSEEKTTEDEEKKEDDEDLIPVNQEPEHTHDHSSHEQEVASEATVEGSGNDKEGSADPTIDEDETDESGSGGVPKNLGIYEDYESTESPAKQQAKVEDSKPLEGLTPAEEVSKASSEDNSGTYILLGILALCLISLMIFVAMKNRKEKNRNRLYDVEKNGATELQDMDKRLLGKPVDKNGNGNGKAPEHTPLINEYPVHKEEAPSPYTSFRPPEITIDLPKASPREKNKSQQSLNENIPNGNGNVAPVHQSPKNGSVPQIPDSDEEVFHPASSSPEGPGSLNVSPEPPKRYSPIYTSQSPRSDRYSPVYSPETGRVKIKLTETPKPKTPVVVTRSRSRAGDYVNTPN
jgi:hypothetical protein